MLSLLSLSGLGRLDLVGGESGVRKNEKREIGSTLRADVLLLRVLALIVLCILS